ncbi:hypothetical protein BH11PSE7_BH11PSE7_32280 [soil metagenome]
MKTSMDSANFLPELADDSAGNSVDAIYVAIKRLWGIDSPALFFRTLATVPEGLASCWAVIEPYAAGGRLQAQALGLADHVHLCLFEQGFETHGPRPRLVAEEWGHIENALASYNRANPKNLMAVAILSMQSGAPIEELQSIDETTWLPPEPLILSSSMIRPEDIEPESAKAIARLSDLPAKAFDSQKQGILMPSLYRHLARYPTFLTYAADVLHSGKNRTLVSALVESTRSRALSKATEMTGRAISSRTPFSIEIENLTAQFLEKIPEMVVMGIFLRGLVHANN